MVKVSVEFSSAQAGHQAVNIKKKKAEVASRQMLNARKLQPTLPISRDCYSYHLLRHWSELAFGLSG